MNIKYLSLILLTVITISAHAMKRQRSESFDNPMTEVDQSGNQMDVDYNDQQDTSKRTKQEESDTITQWTNQIKELSNDPSNKTNFALASAFEKHLDNYIQHKNNYNQMTHGGFVNHNCQSDIHKELNIICQFCQKIYERDAALGVLHETTNKILNINISKSDLLSIIELYRKQ